MALVHDLLDRWKKAEDRKGPWLPYWQELGDVLLPTQANFTSAQTQGQKRTDTIYDGQPRLAARGLITTIDGLLKPKTQRWFWIKTDDDRLNELDEVKLWLEDTQERMWNAIYRRPARFTQRSGEVDEGLVVFGQGALWIGTSQSLSSLSFRSFHLRNFNFDENGDGEIDQFGVQELLKPRQAKGRYGEENLHPDMVKMLRDKGKQETPFQFVQLILPRDDVDATRLDHLGKPFASVTIDVTHEHIVREKGFDEFPVAIPRWDTSPGEIYARSPGMMALPDAKTLQAMGKTLLLAGQKAADPPTWVASDSVLSPVRTWPGGLTVIDADSAMLAGGRDPIGVLDFGKNIPIGREMQGDSRLQVEAAFFKNVFSLPIEGRAMTATEILERKEEFTRTIGPVFGRLEADYIGQTVERVFSIMLRSGSFLAAPEIFGESDANLRFEFMSPIQQARKQIEAAALGRGMEVLGPLMELQPEIADNLNGDEITRDMPDWSGIPQRWITPEAQVEEIRQSRAAREEAAAAAEAVQIGAPALRDLAAAQNSGGVA